MSKTYYQYMTRGFEVIASSLINQFQITIEKHPIWRFHNGDSYIAYIEYIVVIVDTSWRVVKYKNKYYCEERAREKFNEMTVKYIERYKK